MARCLLGLGSNLGDRGTTLRRAVAEVARLPHSQLLARSRWRQTAPIGGPAGQSPFLNGALLLETEMGPQGLVAAVQAIELQLGRNRRIRWDSRSIDIDLLLYGLQVIASPDLLVPHPRMSFRKFVLEPAAEIAGWMVHPPSGWTVSQLLSHLTHAPRYVAVCAAESAASGWLANELAQAIECPMLDAPTQATEKAGDSTPQTAVEFQQWAQGALSPSRWAEDSHLSQRLGVERRDSLNTLPPIVSNYWHATEFESTLDVVRPALVVAWDPASPPTLPERNCNKKNGSETQVPDIPCLEFRNLLDRKGHGPLARIQADDPAIAVQEAVAAVRSVWPEIPMIVSEK